MKLDNILNEGKITGFDPHKFLAHWFFSNKPKDPAIYKELAQKYPYKGMAFRMDKEKKPYNKPYASWSKTTMGIIRWKMTHHPHGIEPPGWTTFRGTVKGIDLAAFVKGEGLSGDMAGKK